MRNDNEFQDLFELVDAAMSPQRRERGRLLVEQVAVIRFDAGRAAAAVPGRAGRYEVTLDAQSLRVSCGCLDDVVCKHIYAVAAAVAELERDGSSGSPAAELVALRVARGGGDVPELFVWAETDARAEWFPGIPGRPTRRVRPHPFAAPFDRLPDWVQYLAVSDEDVVVELESVSRVPFASAAAIAAGRPVPPGTPRVSSWTVPAARVVGLEVLRAVEMLDRSPVPVCWDGVDRDAFLAELGDAFGLTDRVWVPQLRVVPVDGEAEQWELSLVVVDADRGDVVDAAVALRDGFTPGACNGAGGPVSEACRELRRFPQPVRGVATGQVVPVDVDALLVVLGCAQRLADSGVELVVPDGLKPAASLDVSVDIEPLRTSGLFGLDAVVDATWAFRVDGVRLSADAARTVARMGARVVATVDGFTVLSRAQVDAVKRSLRASTLADVLAAGDASSADVSFDELSGSGWVAELLDGPSTPTPVDCGPGFAAVLREHQRVAVERMSFLAAHGIGALLFDEMGLGKTVMGLALTAADRHRDPGCAPTLVLAPKSMVWVWVSEAARFCPGLRVATGPAALTVADVDVVVMSHQSFRYHADVVCERDWRRMIVDEAHVAKEPSTALHKAMRRVRAEQVVVATGTPVQNGLEDLWAVASLALPGLLGSRDGFRRRFGVPIEAGDERCDAAVDALTQRLSPFMLARSKADVGLDEELPELSSESVIVELTDEQKLLLVRNGEQALAERAKATTWLERVSAVLRALGRAKQICNHPASREEAPLRSSSLEELLARSEKLVWTVDKVAEFAAAGEATVVFCTYLSMMDLLVAVLEDRLGAGRVGRLDGSMSEAARAPLAARLADGSIDVAVVSVAAGGTGLTLTGANHVVHYDRWWNPAVEDQATARCHRIGQERPVSVHRLMCAESVEMRVDVLLESKRQVAERVFGATGGDGSGAAARELSRLDDAALMVALGAAAGDLAVDAAQS
jgi:hypothetical protein